MQIDQVPIELFQAVERCDLAPIMELRKRLHGDEVIAMHQTTALFDTIIAHMAKSNPEAVALVQGQRDQMAASTEIRPLSRLVQVIDDLIVESIEAKIKHLSPAAYAVSKLLKGETATTYAMPAEVLPAIQTRRPQLLAFARTRIAEGRFFSHEEAKQILQFCLDYTNSRFDKETISERFPGGEIPLPTLAEDQPVGEAACYATINLLETVIKDLDYNERQHSGVLVPDGQGRGRSILRSLPS